MNAFSTYKDLTVIDFEHFVDHGLYLISGPTGSGKTTIFDAITFALYGSASGSERHQAYFRSDFADDKDETYVEMTFLLHGKEYCIKRSPTYYRKGYKTPKMANAYLTYDEHTIEGVKEVNQKINKLLGVDVHQFKQIVMIAQGEFTKLIYASSEERERVLRHIFHTESYVKLEELLKEETKAYKEKYLLLSQGLIHAFQSLQLSSELKEKVKEGIHPRYIEDAIQENQKLTQEYNDIDKDYQAIKQKSETLSQEYYQKEVKNKNIQTYKDLSLKYQELLKQEDVMKQRKHDIDQLKILRQNQNFIYRYHSLKDDYKYIQEDYQRLTQDIEVLSIQYQKAKQDYQIVPELKKSQEDKQKQLTHYEQSLKQYSDYQDVLTYYQRLHKQYQFFEKEYEQAVIKHQQLDNHMQRDHENIEQLPELQLKMKEMEQAVKEANQRKITIHHLSEIYDTHKNLQDRHYELSKVYQKKHQDYQEILQKYQTQDELFKRQQAGILARDLKENEPCPVCGSLHHPHLAEVNEDILSAHELEALMQDVESLRVLNDDAYQEVLNQNQKIQDMQSQITVYKQQLHIEDDLSKEVFVRLLSNVIQVTKDQEKLYQKQMSEVQYLTKLKNSYHQDLKVFEQETQALSKMLEDKHELEKELSKSQSECNHFKKQLGEETKETLLSKKQILDKELKQLTQDIENKEKNYLSLKEKLNVMKKQLTTLKEKYEQIQVDYHNQEQEFENFKSKYFQGNYDYYQSQLSSLDRYEKQYQDYVIGKETLQARLKELEEYKDEELVDISLLHVQLLEVNKQKEDISQQLNHLLYTKENNEKIIKQIQKDYAKNQEVFDKYTLYQDLTDQASGKNLKRMSFERYVLSYYFEHILEYANIELLKMSQGRYELYRKQEIKGAKQQGLDLSVMDYETGVLRDVQSLSGGESFKAALSLALGLSAMIQSYAGGIELNTLFIDEGFGSLDNESLDQALNVLLDLKNDNKVIGIISHVHELKERISAQIIVEKGKKGSSLYIEND